MSHHGHHHHHHHHHQDHHNHHQGQSFDTAYPAIAYPAAGPFGAVVPTPFGPPTPYGHGHQPVPYGASYAGNYYGQEQRLDLLDHARREEQRHRRNEHRGEMGAAAAGAFALYELHEAKVDPAHAGRHKLEAEIAGTVALGAAGYALHEHMEAKKSEHLVESLGGGSSHHYHHGKHHGHEKKHHHHKW